MEYVISGGDARISKWQEKAGETKWIKWLVLFVRLSICFPGIRTLSYNHILIT